MTEGYIYYWEGLMYSRKIIHSVRKKALTRFYWLTAGIELVHYFDTSETHNHMGPFIAQLPTSFNEFLFRKAEKCNGNEDKHRFLARK